MSLGAGELLPQSRLSSWLECDLLDGGRRELCKNVNMMEKVLLPGLGVGGYRSLVSFNLLANYEK